MTDSHTLTAVMDAAHKAGARIMTDWRKGGAITRKRDGSPVTDTDRAAEDIVVAALRKISPHTIIAEEAIAGGETYVLSDEPFWLVDALDGTRAFIAGFKDFTVNIALIDKGEPVFGVIYAPAFAEGWHAMRGHGAHRVIGDAVVPIRMRSVPEDGYHVLSGVRSAEAVVLEPFIGTHVVAQHYKRQSSLKFCMLAQGDFDLYPRLGPTSEWDTAAGDIIVREAGGALLDLRSKEPVQYGKADRNFENGGFIAGSREALRIQVL